jgi:hypothetical protein
MKTAINVIGEYLPNCPGLPKFPVHKSHSAVDNSKMPSEGGEEKRKKFAQKKKKDKKTRRMNEESSM